MKRINLLIIYIIIFTVLLTGCTNKKTGAIETVKTKNREIQSKLEKYMKDYTASNQFNGSVLVAKNEQVLFENGYGMADADNKIPNTANTVFEIGSITKQFTATAILMLQEKGLLNIQDTIDKYIPDYPNGNKIKIYNLLNHTSGIPDYLGFVIGTKFGEHSYTSKELVEMVKDQPLDFEPGTKFEYVNSNYALLGYIIEKVTGISYKDYLKNNIYTPLKMNHTGLIDSKEKVPEKAVGYDYIGKDSKTYSKYDEPEPSIWYAAGDIYSTVDDLLAWNSSLCSGELIKKESLKEMFTPYLNYYGFGWYINNNYNGDTLIWHYGSVDGFVSLIVRELDKENVVIILSNNQNDSANLDKISKGLMQIIDNN